MKEHGVVIAGGGPTGMMLAGELALAGADVAIIERRPSAELVGSRAGGLHARTIELLDQRGIADRFLAEGQAMQVNGFALIPLDISDFPTRHAYGLALTQNHIERIMAAWIAELPVTVYRNSEVTSFAEDADGIAVRLGDGSSLRARYLVGCDGGRSTVRKAAGIEFPGLDATTSWLIADVEMSEEPKLGMQSDARGVHGIARVPGGGPLRVVITEASVSSDEPTIDDLRAALVELYGTHFGLHSAPWLSRFNDATRQAATYRKGRVFLAGDAANIRPPMGGQGLNLGVHDAVNLGWKLAQVVQGTSPDALLDSYHTERHPVVARVHRNVMAQTALRHTDQRTLALKETLGGLLAMDGPRRQLAGLLSGLDVRFDFGEGHPLLGRRMPDLDVVTPDGPRRTFSLLRDAKHVLLNFGSNGAFDAHRRARLRIVDASYDGRWELPVIGEVDAPHAMLVRPDGHVAWVGTGPDAGLDEALRRWIG